MNQILCPKEIAKNIHYPCGHVLGCSTDVVEFDNKFKMALKSSSLPITLGCSELEFQDCVWEATEHLFHFTPIFVSTSNMSDDEVRRHIETKETKIAGYLNLTETRLKRIIKDYSFVDIPGIHIFHLPDVIVFDSNSVHFYLRPLKYRQIDGMMSIHFWAKAHGEEVDPISCTQAVVRGNYRNAMELVEQYKKIREKPEFDGVVIENESYNEETHEEFVKRVEKGFLLTKLRENGGNVAKTAKQVGISRNTLKKKVELYES